MEFTAESHSQKICLLLPSLYKQVQRTVLKQGEDLIETIRLMSLFNQLLDYLKVERVNFDIPSLSSQIQERLEILSEKISGLEGLQRDLCGYNLVKFGVLTGCRDLGDRMRKKVGVEDRGFSQLTIDLKDVISENYVLRGYPDLDPSQLARNAVKLIDIENNGY